MQREEMKGLQSDRRSRLTLEQQHQHQQQLQNQQPQQPQKCPRCESLNTKFCYYNNYSLSQPRYFCKTCRRYWTKGGTLRNVPVGGGCRKGKRTKRPTSSSSENLIQNPQPQQSFSSASSFQEKASSITSTATNNTSPLRTETNATDTPSIYYTSGNMGTGFLSSLAAVQSFNQTMNVPDFGNLQASSSTSAFNLPLLQGFTLPVPQQSQNQSFQGFQTSTNRQQNQLLPVNENPIQPSSVSAASHQEWQNASSRTHNPPPIDGSYWNAVAGGSAPAGAHWPDLPGFGAPPSSASFL